MAIAKKVQAPQKPIVFTGITSLSAERIKSREGVTVADITAFVQQNAGGNINNVGVRLVDGVNVKDKLPFPWKNKKPYMRKMVRLNLPSVLRLSGS